MKRLFLAALCSIFLMSAKSQDTTSSVNLYAGLVGTGFVQTDSGYLTKNANFRIGVKVIQPVYKGLSVEGWLGLDQTQIESNVIFRASMRQTWKNGGVSAGFQPTPVSEIRPYPFSVDGQFEFIAESMIPGAAFGTSVWYKGVKAGVYSRNDTLEYQVAYTSKNISVGAWTTSKKFGGLTAKVTLPEEVSVLITLQKEKQGLAISCFPFNIIPELELLWDLATENGGKPTDNILGAIYHMDVKAFTDARFGCGYDFHKKSVGVFLLMGLNYPN